MTTINHTPELYAITWRSVEVSITANNAVAAISAFRDMYPTAITGIKVSNHK